MKPTKLNKLLIKQGITGKWLAESLGIPLARFYMIASGHHKTPYLRRHIATFLGVRPRTLWPDYKPGKGKRFGPRELSQK